MNKIKTLALASIVATASFSSLAFDSFDDTQIEPTSFSENENSYSSESFLDRLTVSEWAQELKNTQEVSKLNDQINGVAAFIAIYNQKAETAVNDLSSDLYNTISNSVNYVKDSSTEGYNYVLLKISKF